MKISYKKPLLSLLLVGAVVSACNKQSFVDTNINPDALTVIPPENQLLNATLSLHGQDFEAYYDTYRRIMPWMQYAAGINGNGQNFTQTFDNFSNRYGTLYNGVGNTLVDLEELVKKLPEGQQGQYVHMIRIARIIKDYYTFYVSDIYGSIPYTNAFQARYGGELKPTYDPQQAIFTALDADLKEAITTLKTTQPAAQKDITAYDQYYQGKAQNWVKAANALRLKIAMRLIKRDPAKLKAIAQEVLANPADLMSSNADGWVFVALSGFTSGGNWDPSGLRATKPVVDFMWETKDPRLDAFFTPNNYSQANIDRLIADKQLPAGTKESPRRYLGSFTSPDDAKAIKNIQQYYTRRALTVGGDRVNVDTLSYVQPRLFQPAYSVSVFDGGPGKAGEGKNYLPVITYADFCLMRAELAAQATTSESAKDWYEAGIKASLAWYDMVAQGSQLTNYTPMTPEEITAYLAQPKVVFKADKALELVAGQEYLNFFKQPSGGWATWKRTGYPSATSTLMLPNLISNGSVQVVPRRAPLGLPSPTDPNFANKQAAFDEMAKEPGFGRDPQDATGRVWWDKL